MDNRAQISAELIIVLAALIAIAVVLISGLDTFSRKAEDRFNQESERAIREQIGIGE